MLLFLVQLHKWQSALLLKHLANDTDQLNIGHTCNMEPCCLAQHTIARS